MEGSKKPKKTKSNGMRQRGGVGKRATRTTSNNNPKKKPSKANEENNDGANSNTTNSNAHNENSTPLPLSNANSCSLSNSSLVNDFKPILLITALVLLPYGLQNAYLYVFLQRPEWLLSLATVGTIIRPSVGVNDPRQVLVVGTMSSGTTQVAHDLTAVAAAGLEIGHENSETRWSFVRDGTVSWFHGIRFLPRPGIDDTTSVSIEIGKTSSSSTTNSRAITVEGELLFRYVVGSICRELHPNMGFHPFMFRDNEKCSFRQSWDSCWKEECKNLLAQEWGCALKQASSSSSYCTTPYHKHLLQVRHPLRTVESLVTKFCTGGVEGAVQPSFLLFAGALFPQHDFSKFSCIEAAGYYIYEYNSAMLKAKKKGHIDDVFLVEGATPCAVAKLAGFTDEIDGDEQAHEKRIREKISKVCHDADDDDNYNENRTKDRESLANEGNRPMVSTKNTYNKGQLSLDWDDLLGGKHGSRKQQGDHDLQKRLKKMAHKDLGYN